MGKNRERWRRRIPATPVTGGEGDVGQLKEETEPHPLVPVARRERVGGGRSAVDSEAAEEALVGGGVPVGIGRGGGVGELREVEAQLMEGSAWAKRLQRGGFTTASSSPAFGRSGGGVLGSGVEERAKG